MSKEIEILEDISKEECLFKDRNTIYMGGKKVNSFTHKDTIGNYFKGIEDIKQALQRLEAIDNTSPSEALEILDDFKNGLVNKETGMIMFNQVWFKNQINIIKQALIKAQEQEKKNAYIEKIKTMMKQKDCVLRYIESEDCFAVKTILSDGWYKLTPEFVDDNVREEIKPLPLIEKNKQLKEENAEYKRVLEIIKEKDVDIALLKECKNESEYNIEVQCHNENLMKPLEWWIRGKLTKEEFDLLKRWLG